SEAATDEADSRHQPAKGCLAACVAPASRWLNAALAGLVAFVPARRPADDGRRDGGATHTALALIASEEARQVKSRMFHAPTPSFPTPWLIRLDNACYALALVLE
ncbi:MAG TPA: hypothetical protein VF099_18045, partial [Ktedonobacterales bacterium]